MTKTLRDVKQRRAEGASGAQLAAKIGIHPNSLPHNTRPEGKPATTPKPATRKQAANVTFNDNWQATIDALNQRIGDLEADNAALLQQRDGAQAEVSLLKARAVQDDPLKRDERAEYENLLEFIRYMSYNEQFELFEAGINFGKRQAEQAT